MHVTVVIPAYNEAPRIGTIISETLHQSRDILVIDDGSTDGTGEEARNHGAAVVIQPHAGYIEALKTGFIHARGPIIVTMDADGEHDSSDIPRLIKPIIDGEADLVLGQRSEIPSLSERFIGRLVKVQLNLHDHGTGFRAVRKDVAKKMNLGGQCTCGTFVLEAARHKATIREVPIVLRTIEKPRKRKWIHIIQVCHVVWSLLNLWISS